MGNTASVKSLPAAKISQRSAEIWIFGEFLKLPGQSCPSGHKWVKIIIFKGCMHLKQNLFFTVPVACLKAKTEEKPKNVFVSFCIDQKSFCPFLGILKNY